MKDNIHTTEHLPWAISIEEFRKSGDFKDWNDAAVQQAISTLKNPEIKTK